MVEGRGGKGSWKEQFGDIDPWAEDEKPAPSDWPEDEDKPYDSNYRQYNPYAGSQTPTAGRCNALLTNYRERYGEPRYCTAIPAKWFGRSQNSQFCKTHTPRELMHENAEELWETGRFAANYIYAFDRVSTAKQLYAVTLFDDLLEESAYDFETEYAAHTITADDVDFIPAETVTVDFPVPQSRTYRANALWFAALDFIRLQNMQEVVLEDGPEKEEVIGVTDDGEPIYTTEEHHLNLPISRLTKDYDRHLTAGGVNGTEEGDNIEVDARSWNLSYGPGDDEAEPEQVTEDGDVPLVENEQEPTDY